ncbi:DinB family protein [Sinanaerobacter chloroacetimidivorans]|jgi:hypothetical protein|uniref:DinB family protein n=1 Tax=Sinanaerobacter chloroacetimidivorans TaxID=2818044 RepID=A0A8J8B401_9FIRM|nr:DinB family protein [Sinanaerobacter chloroacetimidivorans]MBR0600296.1 DinB family protein [Sinanaerobacter chloroacetimidivorans]
MNNNSAGDIRNLINFQFDISWQLLEYHFNGLTDEECLWKPQANGLHVHHEGGKWRADWPDSESYDIGPASIAWLTWHIIYWWSMVLDYSTGNGTLTREQVQWSGNITDVSENINNLRDRWKTLLEKLSDDELLSCKRTYWPFSNKPFYELAAWLNLELMKNASEIGYCRFLYASRNR